MTNHRNIGIVGIANEVMYNHQVNDGDGNTWPSLAAALMAFPGIQAVNGISRRQKINGSGLRNG